MPRALAEEIAEDLWNRSDGQGEIMLSGLYTAYLMERGLGMLDRIKVIGNNYQVIQDPSEIPEDIVKVSVSLHEGVAAYADRFVPRWEQANCAVAGPYWIDTTLANKGIGVTSICRILGIDLTDVMAFGDTTKKKPKKKTAPGRHFAGNFKRILLSHVRMICFFRRYSATSAASFCLVVKVLFS